MAVLERMTEEEAAVFAEQIDGLPFDYRILVSAFHVSQQLEKLGYSFTDLRKYLNHVIWARQEHERQLQKMHEDDKDMAEEWIEDRFVEVLVREGMPERQAKKELVRAKRKNAAAKRGNVPESSMREHLKRKKNCKGCDKNGTTR